MKKSIKLIAILALLAIGFTACHKDNGNDYVGTPHKARYEIVSLGEGESIIKLTYYTQNTVGINHEPEVISETTITPWQAEFTFNGAWPLELFAYSEFDDNYERFPIKASLYIDDILVAEQQSDEYHSIFLDYYYDE